MYYVGVNISLATATIAWQKADAQKPTVLQIPQTAQGYSRLVEALKELAAPADIHLVMEATSTYWMDLAYLLFDLGFKLSVINPSKAKYFARMQLQYTKTDASDAILLMHFAQSQKPQVWTPPPTISEKLRQYLTYRQQLIEMQAQLRSQTHAFARNPLAEKDLLERMKQRMQAFSDEIAQLTKSIHALLLSEHDWSEPARFLLSIPGIHTISTAWILVATHCFARCESPEEAAAFAGLVPHRQDSGSSKQGYRAVGATGHRALRNTLYMASAPASRFNPILKAYYENLLRRGKPKKVARIAVARKLLHIAWACVTKQRLFDPNFQVSVQAA